MGMNRTELAEHYEEPYNFSDYVKPEYRGRGQTPDGEWA